MEKCSAYLDGVDLWTLLTLNSRHLGYVAEGEGPLFKQEMAAENVVTTMNISTLYMCLFAPSTTIVLLYTSVVFLVYYFLVNLAACIDLVPQM